MLSQFVYDPRQSHMDATVRVLRYLQTTPGQEIFIPKDGGLNLVAYCDADWFGCTYTRGSRTSFLLLFRGAPVSWKTKKQSVVSRSSAEAEYRATATTISEILWMCWLLSLLQAQQHGLTPLLCGNQAARHIANNPFPMRGQSMSRWVAISFEKEWNQEKFRFAILTQRIKF